MFKVFARSLRQFRRDASGNVAMLFGLALIPILIGAGVAVDYGRALIVRERMADAADAAALAIGSWPGLSEAELKTKAQQFFDANYPPDKIGAVGKLNVQLVGDDIKVSVNGLVPTTFMQLANINTMDVGVTATITKKERNIELALVLDTTGSMGSGGKMSAMQNAAKKMVQTLFQDKSTSDTLKIAVVPFAAAVNVGSDKKNESWIDRNATSDIAWEDFKKGVKVFDLYDDLKNRKWEGCVRERDGNSYELTDAAPSSGTPASLFAPYFAPDEPDKENNATNDYIEDKNCSGKDNEYDTKQRCTAKYDNATVTASSLGPDRNCPPRAITPLTNNQGPVISAIEQLQPKGYTVIPAGLLWGWRVLSPTEPYTEGKPYDDEKWVKAIVLLTDGQNDVRGGVGNHNRSEYNAFGYAAEGHLGKTNGSNAESTLNSKLATVCNNVKAQGILVYTITFQVNNSTTQNLLKNCATKPDMYYNSPSNDQLAAIFQDIAQGLSELRIAQ